MILSELRDYLQIRHRAALQDMANHFDVEPDAIRGMLSKWVNKGKVEKLMASTGCGSTCSKCDPAATEVYQWKD